MVDLKQQLNLIDYFGAITVWVSFFAIIFVISITCILWCCVSKDDDQTVFAKYGMGPKQRTSDQKYAAQTEKAE